MEEHIAILMADLSGYTALTETHGAISAADTIDKYIGIVEKCLVGDCKLHERKGDEIMIIASSPDFLIATAYMIMNATSGEDNFLQVHGGLHFGKALKRGNSYFGSAINLTSRIAAKAEPGNFWCSGEFANSLSDTFQVKLHAKGKHSFKNISEHQDVYALKTESKNAFYIDSVCRMMILDTNKAIRHPTEENVFFCSTTCRDIYIKNQSDKSDT